MEKILADLWNGNIAPCEQCGAHDPEIKDLAGLMERNREALCKGLTSKQQETFDKYLDCSEEYTLRLTQNAFGDGFCLAAKLLTQALASGRESGI